MTVIDKSAVLAVINLEDDAKHYAEAIQNAEELLINAVNYFELTALIEIKFGDSGLVELNNFFKKADIKVHEVDEKIVDLAREIYKSHGRPKNPENGLAFGDCFSYALAKFLDKPLLFKGEQFARTDIISALHKAERE